MILPHTAPALADAASTGGPGFCQPDCAYTPCGREPPPKPIRWGIYKIASKAVWLGNVEATDEAAAIEKGAAEFKVTATRLLAVRR